jgi:hypothetical protein
MAWYRNDKAAVAEALRRGERPDLATTMASGPLDELVALHEELGIFAILDELEVQRERAGVADALLLRTLATLSFVEQASAPRSQRSAVQSQRCSYSWAGRQCRSAKGAMGDIGTRRGGKQSRYRVIRIPCVIRCGGSASRPDCKRITQGSRSFTSGSWYVAGSMRWMAAG